jgi:hypothetical protein
LTIIPDVLGYKLQDAEELLSAKKCCFQTIETFPRRREPMIGNYRVIRQIQNDGMILLTICKVPG